MAAAAVSNASLRGNAHAKDSLDQLVSDNFDAQISSRSGLLSTHSLAMPLTFVDKHGKDDPKDQTFCRITKDEMKDQIVEDIPVQRYYDPKKPDMPSSKVNRSVLPLRVMAHQVVALERVRHLDFEFFKSSTNPIELSDFNTPPPSQRTSKYSDTIGFPSHPVERYWCTQITHASCQAAGSTPTRVSAKRRRVRQVRACSN